MLAQTLFHTLMSNLERLEGSQALIEIGLPLSWEGKKQWAVVTINNKQHWDFMMWSFLEAAIVQNEKTIDPYITALSGAVVVFKGDMPYVVT